MKMRLKGILVAVLATVASHAWSADVVGGTSNPTFTHYDWPEQCVPVYDPLLPSMPLLGDFCYAASGTMRASDLDSKTMTRFSGGGIANLYAPGTHTTPGTGVSLGATHFTLKNRTVTDNEAGVKVFTLSFDSNQFQVGSGNECRQILVDMRFAGYDQIGGTPENPIYDFTRLDDEVVVVPCLAQKPDKRSRQAAVPANVRGKSASMGMKTQEKR